MESLDGRMLAATLQRLAAQGVASAQIAEAIVSTWVTVDEALTPLIGSKGMVALYARSLFLVRGPHPWLAALHLGPDTPMDFLKLRALLLQQDAVAAAAAGGAHLQTLYELLGSLIGPTLTRQLLGAAWANPHNGAAAKDVSP